MRVCVPSSLLLAGLLSARSAIAAVSFSASAVYQGQAVNASFVPGTPMSSIRKVPTTTEDQRKRAPDDTTYTTNWCGATTPIGSGSDPLMSVSGYFTVPNLTLRADEAAPQYAAAWVGIDGATCKSALLQAGVTTVVNSNSEQSASVWWEWLPDSSYTITSMPAEPGDWFYVQISASSSTSGQIIINNVSQDYNLVTAVSDGPALCLVDADWILEDFSSSGELVNLADFQTLWFEGCSANTTSGNVAGISTMTTMIDLGNYTSPLCTATAYDSTIFYLLSSSSS